MATGGNSRSYQDEAQPFLTRDGGGDSDDPELFEYEDKLHNKRSSGTPRGRIRRWLFLAVFLTMVMAAGVVTAFVLIAEEESSVEEPEVHDVPEAYRQAVVASDAALCSTVGKDILLKGGNAVDAAVASLLCGGLTDPQSMGIGGGFFMTIYNRTLGTSTIIDARETAPEKATSDMYKDDPSASSAGPLSIAVPAEVKGYWSAHQKYGRLRWKEVFEPAIKMAAGGFPVPIGLHNAIQDDKKLLTTEPSLRAVFFNKETNALFKEGENMTRPQLARTLKVISEEGMAAFYDGSLTDDIMADLSDIGSIITRADLKNYLVLEKTPLEISLDNGVRVISPPPPAGGAVLSFILNILDGYKMNSKSIADEKSQALTYHRIVEAFKFAYAKRTDLGDEDFVDVKELVKNLTSKAYADYTRGLISDTRTFGYEYYGPTFYSRNTTSTSHLSVLDQDGSAVSVTSTVNARFGSQRRGMRSGIIFNDEMDDFSSPNITNEWGLFPSPANFIVPGKRPLSSMCPAVFLHPDGSVNKVLGAAGGSKITTATAWVAVHNMWLGENIEQAIDHRRLHHQLLPPHIQYEEGFDQNLIADLQKFGHNVSQYSLGASIVQGIDVENGLIFADSDFRKGGIPDGF